MQTTEVIPWKTLHPWQRNQVIAEKIIGVTDFHCLGKLDYRGNNTMLGQHYYRCQQCQATLTVTDAMPRGWKPSVHNILTPHYSEDLDAAFEMLRHFIGETSETYTRARAFFAELGRVEGPVHVVMRWNDFAVLTAEKLCVMALQAMGYEVEQ
jgi:hypothetical protein